MKTQEITMIADGVVQIRVTDPANAINYYSAIDNKHGIEVLTSVRTLKSYVLLVN